MPAAGQRLQPALPSQATWVLADFDGDHQLDLVSIDRDDPPRTQFGSFSSGTFAVPFGISTQRLRARDLDGDDDRDIVLETLASVPLAVWINDGTGHFQRGNLEKFRSLLPHDSSRSFESVRVIKPDATDDSPRIDAPSRPFTFSIDPACAKLKSRIDAIVCVACDFVVGPRGPPLSA